MNKNSEFEGYCVGNVIKYVLRYKCKGGDNDLYKAREYIDFLIRSLNREPILEGEDDEEVMLDDENAIWDGGKAWRCWTCQNNRNLDRVVTRTYKE